MTLSSHVLIPVGKYTLNCSYNAFEKKDILVKIKAEEVTKVHVVFSQFFIEAKCLNGGDDISYEIYASSGQMVYDKKAKCSDTLKVTVDNGDYSVDAKMGNDKKEVKFTVSGNSNRLLIDMTDIKRESTKEELIKADSQETAVAEPTTPKKEIRGEADKIPQIIKCFESANSVKAANACERKYDSEDPEYHAKWNDAIKANLLKEIRTFENAIPCI